MAIRCSIAIANGESSPSPSSAIWPSLEQRMRTAVSCRRPPPYEAIAGMLEGGGHSILTPATAAASVFNRGLSTIGFALSARYLAATRISRICLISSSRADISTAYRVKSVGRRVGAIYIISESVIRVILTARGPRPVYSGHCQTALNLRLVPQHQKRGLSRHTKKPRTLPGL